MSRMSRTGTSFNDELRQAREKHLTAHEGGGENVEARSPLRGASGGGVTNGEAGGAEGSGGGMSGEQRPHEAAQPLRT